MTSRFLERLIPRTTALLLVDFQRKLLPRMVGAKAVQERVRLLLRAAKTMRLPVVVTTQSKEKLGDVVDGITELLTEANVRVDKTHFSCFDESMFEQVVKEIAPGATSLLVAGIESHICVAGTVLGGLRLGYRMEVIADAVSARRAEDRRIGLERMRDAGGMITCAEMAVYELLKSSDTVEFREMRADLKAHAEAEELNYWL